MWFRACYFIKASRTHMCAHTQVTYIQHTPPHPLPSSQLLKLSQSIQDMPLENVAAIENISLDIWWPVYVLSTIENLLNWSSYNVSRPLNLCEKASWRNRLNKGSSESSVCVLARQNDWVHFSPGHFGFWTVKAHMKQDFFPASRTNLCNF